MKNNGKSQTNGKKKEGYLEKFFVDQLRDVLYAEQQLLKALTEMQGEATTEELADAFAQHHTETERQVKRLKRIFEMLGKEPTGKKCEAIEGIIKEARSIIRETKKNTMTRDAALIIAAQKAEHYEIATYGGLVQLAITLGKRRIADILEKTLVEEEKTDKFLTYIAEAHINIEAEEEDGMTEEAEEEEMATS